MVCVLNNQKSIMLAAFRWLIPLSESLWKSMLMIILRVGLWQNGFFVDFYF